uniref:Uncharacterized protein n=1 Tax=Panagrolaimus sp. PS1159 TaxID=55785 RepID=A0AC35EUG4_9BILA
MHFDFTKPYSTIFFQYAYHISPFECRAVIIRWKCLFLRIPGFSPIICFSLLHLFIFLERCCATFFLKTYENAPKRYGYAAVALLLSIFGLWVYYIFHDEDLFRYNPYCGATSPTSAPRILNTYYVMLGLDAGCTIGDFWLLWLSKKRMNLRNAFATSSKKRMNLRNAFATSSVEGAHVIVTIYTFATLYLLWFLHQRIYHQRSQGTFNPKVCPQNEADVYFKMFNSQITGY